MSRPKKRFSLAGGLDPESDDETKPHAGLSIQQVSAASAEHPRPTKRMRRHATSAGFSGGLDPDSDDETDLEVTATSNASGRATITYRAFPTEKKPRPEPLSQMPAPTRPDSSNAVPSASDSTKRNQVRSLHL